MKRSQLDAIALASSATPFAMSQLVWLDSADGAASGAQIFAWLWLPPALSLITLLLTTRTRGVGRILRAVLAISSLGWVALIGFFDWRKAEYILEMASQHSGLQISELAEISLTPAVWVACGALVFSALVWMAATFSPHRLTERAANSRAAENPEAAVQDSDPRNLWEEQAS